MGVKIFVISVGRSGSKSVAKEYGLLHEPDGPSPQVQNVINRAGGRLIYGESSHFWKNKIKQLGQWFPYAHYVHLVRHPLAVVASFQHRKHYRGESPASSYQEEILPVEGFAEMSRLEKLAWYWRFWNERITEDLLQSVPSHTVAKLEDLDLAAHENKGPQNKEWGWSERGVIMKICGKLAWRFGYR